MEKPESSITMALRNIKLHPIHRFSWAVCRSGIPVCQFNQVSKFIIGASLSESHTSDLVILIKQGTRNTMGINGWAKIT